jgi:crossover junction endodeoxyribonuclease RuvC
VIIAGIDPSLSCTAIVIGSGTTGQKRFEIDSKPDGLSTWAHFQRYERLAAEAAEICKAEGVGRIMLEGYAFKAPGRRQPVYEFGGVLRLYLLDIDKRLREVPPSQLKQFATGKGNAKKGVVMACVAKRWGFKTRSHDLADAYTLHRIGLCVEGVAEPETLAEEAIVAGVIAGPQPKPKGGPRRKKAAKKAQPKLFPEKF